MTGSVRDRIDGCCALLAFLCLLFRFALTLANLARYRSPTEDTAWTREAKPVATCHPFVVLIAGTAYFEHKVFVLGGDIGKHLNLIYGLMWWVTVASILARLVMRESPRDASFRWGGWAGTRARTSRGILLVPKTFM